MSDNAKPMKPHDARVFYLVLIATVAVIQIVLKVVTTVLPDIPSQVCSRITECVLQHGVERTLPADKWYIALPVSALVFAMLHIYHSLYYVFGAIGLALVSGVLYHRQKNVWPCFALHFLLAFLPRCFGLK